jgi:hypothetical protein
VTDGLRPMRYEPYFIDGKIQSHCYIRNGYIDVAS